MSFRPRLVVCLIGALVVSGCGGKGGERKKPPAPLVVAAVPVRHRFVDVIEAVGTARANEQVTIASPVTERLERVLFDDGMAVGKGQLLAVLSQGQEDAQLHGAMAMETQATAQYQRIKSLADRGFATRTQLDQQLAAAEGARASAAEARAAIGDRMIRAPFAGYTSLRTISAGTVVNTGTPLVTISDLSRIKLDFTVPETRLQSLRVGQPIGALAAAFPGTSFAGTITSIDPVIDPSSRAVLVRATLPNPGARIKPGMLMTVRVSAEERLGDAVPELAVTGMGDARFVYVVTPQKKAKQVPVRTGLRDAGLIEVSGLPPGARVIGDGVVKVADGMAVRLRGDKSRRPHATKTAAAD
ncbi:MAG: efflux RND transporter periplasmic adaptor subunit [Sphingomonadales bacterium]|nr:efflux RND transporter periplasmic adaptor subunit [Sphingomonadales bacterium]